MSIWLKDKIKDAVLAMRWNRAGEGPHPAYFVDASPDSLQLADFAASFLAQFISDHIVTDRDKHQHDAVKEDLDKYSLEEIASYLEDQGYAVSSPD
jgi:hypothetical protein